MVTILEIVLSNALMAAGLAVVAFAVSKLWRRPAVAHALWLLVLIKLLTPPLFPIEVPWPTTTTEIPALEDVVASPAPDGSVTTISDVASEETVTTPEFPEVDLGTTAMAATAVQPELQGDELYAEPLVAARVDWSTLLSFLPAGLLCVWLMGTAAWFALLTFRILQFQRLLRFATPAPLEIQEHCEGLGKRLGLAHWPTLWMVPGAVSPMLWGIVGRPRLLIPNELWKGLDWSQRGALLTHELAHFRRRDHWVRGLELVVTGFYWWHPVVWWARHELREAEEQCCDAWVLWALPAAKQSYAQALVETMDFLSKAAAPLPVLASGFGHIHHLKRRLSMILRGSTPRTLTWAGGLCVLGLAALLLPIWPTWAQPPRSEPPRGEERRREDPARRDGDERERDLDRAREEIQRLREQLRRAEEQLERLTKRRPDAPAPREGDRPAIRGGGADRRPEEKPQPGGGPMGPGPGGVGPGGPMGPGPGGLGPGGAGGPMGRGGAGAGRGPGGPMGAGVGGPGGGFGGFPGMAGGGVDIERRLSEVEKKLDHLLKAIEGLRPGGPLGPDGRRGPGAGAGGLPPGGPTPPAIRDGDRRQPTPPTPPRDGERKREREDDRSDLPRR